MLFVFKYLNFALDTIASIANSISIPMQPLTVSLLLPVGISFYTFQALSYVIDVYRGDIRAEKNFIVYATFVAFFPQLVAGPIERTANLLPQIKAVHHFNEHKALEGAKLMLWGYFKKLVIADQIAGYVDMVYADLPSYKGFDLVLVIFFFTIQIYCDFSGYSDIAIGTAKLLDIDLMTNFKSPYFSASVKEFWSRWHISLSTWFRDYLYIPLGGNRCSSLRHSFNLMITFLVSGLWHGASWTFVIWGGIHGLAQVMENTADKWLKPFRKTKAGHVVCVAVVFIFCNIAWVFFRADSFEDAFYMIRYSLSGIINIKTYFTLTIITLRKLKEIGFFICILGLYDFYAIFKNNTNHKFHKWIVWAWYLFLALTILFCTKKGEATEFVYFQF